ncbi:MAG: hypothetical protein LBP30_01600 [Clostridiales Family XIII bacterium]|jgi:hypothetical protein|nr:hypothetical protein [Clostridiales Family XIII bacterium]
MGIKEMGANLTASAFGNPKKAFLLIHKRTEMGIGLDVETLAEKAILLSASVNPDTATMSGIFGGGENTHILQVQYNPASIEFMANSEPIPASRLQQNVFSDIPPQFNKPPSVTMSVQLVFDAVNVKDSFMADKFSPKVSDLVSVPAAIRNRANYTVQPQTNALLAMLMRKETQHVIFYWSGLTFNGIVVEAQAKYTMFSVSGRPVRSVVKLRISQNLVGSADEMYWNKALDKCFGGADMGGAFGGQSKGQNVGNLLNLGF